MFIVSNNKSKNQTNGRFVYQNACHEQPNHSVVDPTEH